MSKVIFILHRTEGTTREQCLEHWAGDALLRVLLAVVAFVTMFHPDDTLVWTTGFIVLTGVVVGVWRHRQIAPPKPAAESAIASAPVPPSGQLSELLVEVKRDF
jgi:hypothetical protein